MNEALKASGIGSDSAKVTLAVTAASYATAFAFERGSAAFLGVPQDLVAVDLRSLLPCAAAAVMVLILLLPILELLAAWWPRWWPAPLQRRARNAVAPVFIWSSFALVLWDGTLWAVVAGTSVLSAISVLHHWMRYRAEGPAYIAALDASDAQPSKWRYLIDLAQNRWGPKPGLFLLAYMILTVGAYVIGYSEAQRQRFFWVSEDADPPCVLVRAYSDRVICRLYDRAGSKVLPQYLMLARKGLPSFRLEEVGPLEAARAQSVVRVRPRVEHVPAAVASNDHRVR